MNFKKSASSGSALNFRQRAALKAAEDAFVKIVQRGYAAGLDASWLQLALWHATDRVEQWRPPAAPTGVPTISKPLLTPKSGSAKVARGHRKKKAD